MTGPVQVSAQRAVNPCVFVINIVEFHLTTAGTRGYGDSDEAFLAGLAYNIHSEWIAHHPHLAAETLHPCYISGNASLITRKGLSRDKPAAFRALVAIGDKYGIRVLEDRREHKVSVINERRRNFALSVGLFMCLSVEQPVLAENIIGHDASPPASLSAYTRTAAGLDTDHQGLTTALSAHRDSAGNIRIGKRQWPAPTVQSESPVKKQACRQVRVTGNDDCAPVDPVLADRIEKILFEHIHDTRQYAGDIRNMLSTVSAYYARYPAVVEMLTAMDELDWRLHVTPGTWEARAWIDHGRVNNVEVHFDPGTAAQMIFAPGCATSPACTVSPADALLHELIHAHLMLGEPGRYAANNAHALYPVEHEHEVIELENRLYRNMSRTDGMPRPNRSRHQAELVAVDCAVCIPGES